MADETLAVSYPDELLEGFVSGLDGESLAESKDWQRLMRLLPEEKTFVAYLSLARILEEVSESGDLERELANFGDGEVTLEALRPIRSLGIATTPIDGGWGVRIAVLVAD